jgi:hypothetical protein
MTQRHLVYLALLADDGRETHRNAYLNRARVPRLEDEPMRAPMRPDRRSQVQGCRASAGRPLDR